MRLIQYLSEKISTSNRAPLYHFTSLTGAIGIVSLHGIGKVEYDDLATFSNPKLIKGDIYFTRSKKYKVHGSDSVVAFEVDQEKLKSKYKVKPRAGSFVKYDNHPGAYRAEAEEFVKGPIKLDPVLINIYIDRDAYKELKSGYDSFVDQLKNIENRTFKSEKMKALSKKSLENHKEKYGKLLFHKKLKVGLP